MALLELLNVSRQFGNIEAVKGITLTIQRGEFISLLGPSGCGKTTTLRLIAGFEAPDGGVIRFKDTTYADGTTFVAPRDRHIGMVFQDYALFPHLNVAQNVGFGLQQGRERNEARVSEMLNLVGLHGFDHRMPFELSGGEQQRVALARALAPAPEMVLMDEPFSSLDAALRIQLRSEMKEILRQADTTCIFVTHAQDEALSLSDRVAVMFEGQIAQMATPEMLYEAPASFEVGAFVGEANQIIGEASGDYADTILGRVQICEPAFGKIVLLIRPETLLLLPDNSDGEYQTSVKLLWSEYYGHNRRVGLMLRDGTKLIARISTTEQVHVGSSMQIRLRHSVRGYPQN